MDIVEQAEAAMCETACLPKYCLCSTIGDLTDEIKRLRKALQAVVDAHGTGQGIGAQGAGSWLDQARQALDGK